MNAALIIVGGLIVAAIILRNRGRAAASGSAQGSGTTRPSGSGAARPQPRSGPPPRGSGGMKAAWRAQLKAIHRSVGIIVFVLVIYFALIFIREFL
jgi:hypothetical protein